MYFILYRVYRKLQGSYKTPLNYLGERVLIVKTSNILIFCLTEHIFACKKIKNLVVEKIVIQNLYNIYN